MFGSKRIKANRLDAKYVPETICKRRARSRVNQGEIVKKLFLTLTLLATIGNAAAQYEGAVNTLQQAGWFDSHHKAYQYGEQRQVYRAQEEQMRLYRELATQQINAAGNFQRVNLNVEQQNTRCIRTVYGVQCN